VPETSNFSLCHSADKIIQTAKFASGITPDIHLNTDDAFKPFDLPSSITDWSTKVEQLYDPT
jgi:hypothetical protein